jgi:hypothetical protein
LAGILTRLSRKLRGKRIPKEPKPAVNDILGEGAAQSSADFIEPLLSSTLLFRRGDRIRDFAISRAPAEGLLLELGVYRGDSINQFADILAKQRDPRPIHGFDAFLGLSEDWFGKSLPQETNLSRKGKPPPVRSNVRLEIGWLEATLAPFLARHSGSIAFMHIDTDTYSPCKLALSLCRERFVDGTILLFDEHHGYPNWQNGEFKALNEILQPDDYRYLAFATQQAVIRIGQGAPAGTTL